MTQNRAVTYSLLAHIRNSGTLIKGPIDPFIPLIKRSLYKLNTLGILSGKSITEIHKITIELYGIDFPLPVLNTILIQIANEVNQNETVNFCLYKDGSFALKNFFFEEFENQIQTSKREVEALEKLYLDFLELNKIELKEKTTIIDFIDKNKISISKYLANNTPANGHDYTIEAQFVEYFRKIPDIFDIVKNIYLGSIISGYLEYKTENPNQQVELVFDTNFIISLIDLNTPESMHTCSKLLEVCKNLGYKFTVLIDTIDETKALLQKKAEYYSSSILLKRINPEDIYNACERRNLKRNDLERIIDNLEDTLVGLGIIVLPNTDKYKNEAKHSKEYEFYKKVRSSFFSALHDATALYYIRSKRKKKIKQFEKVNCWFVNNSITHDTEEQKDSNLNGNGFQPEIIRADELLNILWLSNPSLSNSMNSNELVEIGLSSIVAFTLNSSLPKSSIIRELDENIQKYRGETITDKEILLISSRISQRQLKNISELNQLAKNDDKEFAARIKKEADKQQQEEKERMQKLEQLFHRFEEKIELLDKARQDVNNKKGKLENEIKEANENQIEKNKEVEQLQQRISELEKLQKSEKKKNLENARKLFIDEQVKKWRQKTDKELIIWISAFIMGIISLYWYSNWDLEITKKNYIDLKSNFIIGNIIVLVTIIFSSITIRKWYDKHHNMSNIDNFKKNIELPPNLKEEE